jgi:hypothetical protein
MLKNIHIVGFTKSFWTAYKDYFLQQGPLLLAFVIFTPAFLYDLLKFSHRLAGPLYRCRQLMAQMGRGKTVPEFKPRNNDLVRELEQAFNALIREWNARLEAEASVPQGQKEEALVEQGSGADRS